MFSFLNDIKSAVARVKFNNRLSSLIDQGYAGAFVASKFMDPGATAIKTEGPIPMGMTMEMVVSFVEKAHMEVFGAPSHFSTIKVLDKKALALFNNNVYFEAELVGREFMIISHSQVIID